MTVTFEEVLRVANDLMFAKKGRYLSDPEIIVMKGAWNDKDYEEIASNSRYSLNYLQRTVAPQLWDIFSEVIGNGARVGKKRLRYFLEQVTTKYYSSALLVDTKRSSPSDDTPLYVLGGQPPDTSSFYGRIPELAMLRDLVLENRCVVIYGATGIGKSALTAKLVEEISVEEQSKFDCLIWKSIAYAPALQDLVTELTKLINTLEPKPELPEHTQARISVLIKQLQSRRCLLVLDGAEVLLQENSLEEYAEYKLFFRRLVEEKHQSCLLLTSRVPFDELDSLVATRPVQSLKIKGLDSNAALQLLHARDLTDQEMCNELTQTYRGNPSELEAAANRINHFFTGSKEKFFEHKTTFVSNYCQAALNQYFGRSGLLSELQRQFLIYLAEELSKTRNPISFTKILRDLSLRQEVLVSGSQLMQALEGLEKLSLVESSKDLIAKEVSYALEPTIKKYILTDPLGLVRKSGAIAKSA